MRRVRKVLCWLGCLTLLTATAAWAEKFVVGFQPYDTISYPAIVNMQLGLWKKYVPAGTEIEFLPALQGTVVANNILAGKAQIGYMSVMPATILCSKPEQAEVKMVASLGMSEGTRCSLVMVKKDAPNFKDAEDLARWLDGKVIAAPKGSASDQYLRSFFARYHVKPGEYLNQSIEVIGTNFRIGKLDAASLWEPTLSRIGSDVGEGIAKIAADGRACDNPDLGILCMRADFIKNHPDVAKGYLRSEMEAQRFVLDPKNWAQVVELVAKQASGIPKKVLWYSLYGQVPSNSPEKVREWKNFYFGDRENKNIVAIAPFLFKEKVISMENLKPGTVDDSLAREVFKESGYTPVSETAALGVIEGAPASASPPFTD